MYYQNEKDSSLVMLTLAGEQKAYEVLVTRYQKAVIASAIAVTKNHFMAEDAAQDAFVTAWMKLNTLREAEKYGSWVCRIAKNCALNMITRYRSFLPLDVVDNLNIYADFKDNPEERFELFEERDEVIKSIDSLSERIRQIIRLHYFDGLSIADIADRMCISEGTVKSQLHDGRKQIRKELCAMNEKYNDTLLQRVMKKVEELKLWQIKNDKSGFEKVYKNVLKEVEELPESIEKNHAIADVLMRGWWWIPGKKNEALFGRIKEAALCSKNEEVMTFIVSREDSNVYGNRALKIDFIKNKQIPFLEKAGFVKALGREWFWLGYNLCRDGKADEGKAAYEKAGEILPESDAYRLLVPYAQKMEEMLLTLFNDTVAEHYLIGAATEEYRIIDGEPRYWSGADVGKGYLSSIDRRSFQIFRNASCCDGIFFADIALGQTYVGSDGTRLTYSSDNESVETPIGTFEGCKKWEIRRWTDNEKIICKTYYKDGVGIVRQEHISDGISTTQNLISYEIKGGNGLLPLYKGNSWEYAIDFPSDVIKAELTFTVSYADSERIMITQFENCERLGYDESSWSEMIQQIANEYYHTTKDGDAKLCDVRPVIKRAEALATTPMEKAHTKAAASVCRRILETNPTFNPDYTAKGFWNFFMRTYIRRKNDTLYRTEYNSRFSFEWKGMGTMGSAEDPLLYNDILGILQDAANCIWSDEWQVGTLPIVEYDYCGSTVKTKIICEDGGTVTTKAGRFENCLKLCMEVEGLTDGIQYRSGKKAYYFAEGVGVVRTENEYCGGAKTAVYELTCYEGKGEGYMPISDGLFRRYDALNLTDGFVGAAEYYFVEDEDGDIVVFSDSIGIREMPPPVTQYSTIYGEQIENELWQAGKWNEGHMKYGANNFHLILHLLSRPSRNRGNAKRSVEINGFYLRIMEQLSENGEVPPAWYSLYAWTSLVRAAALFGDGRKEDGYNSLDIAVNYYEKASCFKNGALLELGNKELFCGAKFIYGNGLILLENGSKEPASYDYRMTTRSGELYYILTAPRGWEWFDSVRSEEHFKGYIERAKKLADMK